MWEFYLIGHLLHVIWVANYHFPWCHSGTNVGYHQWILKWVLTLCRATIWRHSRLIKPLQQARQPPPIGSCWLATAHATAIWHYGMVASSTSL